MPELGKATYTLELNTRQYDSGLVAAEAKANAATTSIAQKFQGLGHRASKALSTTGAHLTKALTVPLLAIGGAAAVMAYRFEGSMTKIAALVGVGEKQMHTYHDAVLALVDVVGKGPKELADALYFITSAGFEGESALRVLEASAKASAAGLGETEIVADAVTSAVNAYGESVLSAASATDIMLAAVREGKAEPAAFAASIGRVIAPANLLGVSFDEVSAAIAAMSLQGLDAAESTTALRGVLLTFARPTVEAVRALKSLGKESGLNTAEAVRASIANKGLLETMVLLKEAFGDNVEGLTAVFGNVRAFVGGQILTGTTLQKNQKIFDEINGTVGDTDRAFERVSETAEFKLDRAMARIEKSLTILGGTILPMVADGLSEVADIASRLGDKFNKLSPETQKLLIVIGGIAAIAGPTLLFVGALVAALTALIPVVAFLATGTGLLVAAIVALGVAMVAAKTAPEQTAQVLEKLGLSAHQAAVVVMLLADAFDVGMAIITGMVKNAGVVIGLAFKQIENMMDIVIGILTLDWRRAWSGFKGIVMDPLNAVKALFMNWVNGIKGIFEDLWANLRRMSLSAALKVVEPFSHLPGRMGAWARRAKDEMQKELERLNGKQAADKTVTQFGQTVVPGFHQIGVKSGLAMEQGLFGMVDPMLLLLSQKTKAVADTIFTEIGNSVKNTLNDLAGAFDAALGAQAAAEAGAKGAQAFWDGKKWRDAQGKVLKDQQAAWNAFNAKMGESIVQRKPPKVGTKISLAAPAPKEDDAGGGGGVNKPPPISEIIPLDMQIQRERAAQTKGEKDDLAILNQQEDYLRGLLTRRNLSKKKRLEINQALSSVIQEINGINEAVNETIEKELVLKPPRIERAQAKAALTKRLDDDLKSAKAEREYLRRLLKSKGLDANDRHQIQMALIQVNGRIDGINKQIREEVVATPVLWTARMRIRKTKAERTESLKDDLKVQKDELAYLRKLLKNKKLDLEQRATIMEEITSVLNRIKEINKEVADASKETHDEMKTLAFNIMGERAGFFGTFGSNVFTGGEAGLPRMPGASGIPGASGPAPVPQQGSQAFAKGGVVKPYHYATGGVSGKDTVPAMLSPGEVVLNKRQIANVAGALGTQKTPSAVFKGANMDQLASMATKMRDTRPQPQAKSGTTVEKFENHQHFQAPTPDRNREARMAQISIESVFDAGTYHG